MGSYLLPLLAVAGSGYGVRGLEKAATSTCAGAPRRWGHGLSYLNCQTECAVDRGCSYFVTDNEGGCATYSECQLQATSQSLTVLYDVYQYGLRSALRGDLNDAGSRPAVRDLKMTMTRPFILGTILYGNEVL